jgi:hypothetical protein
VTPIVGDIVLYTTDGGGTLPAIVIDTFEMGNREEHGKPGEPDFHVTYEATLDIVLFGGDRTGQEVRNVPQDSEPIEGPLHTTGTWRPRWMGDA